MAKDRANTSTMNAPVPTTSDALSGMPSITEHVELLGLEGNLARLHRRRTDAATKQSQLEKQLRGLRAITAESKFADDLMMNPDVPQADPQFVSLSSELDAVTHELAALDRAIQQMHAATGPIETLKAELCRAACRAVAPLHRQHARGVVNGLLTLYAAQQQQGRLHDQLWEKGYDRTSHLVNIFVTDFGLISDSGSWISAMLRDFTESGVISEDERIQIIHGEMTQLEAHA